MVRERAEMNNTICIVTGPNSGVGKATTRELVLRGAHVVMACRNLAKGARGPLFFWPFRQTYHVRA
jgi:NAD(P)-dependent dehydrogenase (short-subunit alcohol dehydrogenase family)